MEHAAVLAAFDEQVRRNTRPDGTGAVFEEDGVVIRRLACPGHDGSGIFWSDLGAVGAEAIGAGAVGADAVIAAQVDIFAGRGEEFEWKLYSYDKPADLADRLVAAGFVAEEPESLMIAEVAGVISQLSGAELPSGVRIERVTDEAGMRRMAQVEEAVFHRDDAELRASLLAQLTAMPQTVELVLAVAGDQPVCAARIEFLADTEFAGLWGGGTLPQWRRRGIYRALVRHRAELAAARGYAYLTVDASPDSRPILERVGFSCLAITTPYIWSLR
jgi:ribosomal protein S18 acetylase RimI-like enzyme